MLQLEKENNKVGCFSICYIKKQDDDIIAKLRMDKYGNDIFLTFKQLNNILSVSEFANDHKDIENKTGKIKYQIGDFYNILEFKFLCDYCNAIEISASSINYQKVTGIITEKHLLDLWKLLNQKGKSK
jgi:hypothetical protein